MADQSDFYKNPLDSLSDGVYLVDRDRVITAWNKAAERITGYGAARVLGSSCRDHLLNHIDASGVELCGERCPLAATMLDGEPRSAEVFLHHADGHRVPVYVRAAALRDENGQIIGAVETFNEDSRLERLRQHNAQLARDAQTDVLTGVGNRRYLESHLQSAVAAFHQAQTPLVVLFLDLDRFKQVNDTYGHAVGDQVLKMVAATLQDNLRINDQISRWGGEEFVILLPDTALEAGKEIAERLRVLVANSRLDLELCPVSVTLSIGMTLLRAEDNPETLIRRADGLMYLSKDAGRNRVTIG